MPRRKRHFNASMLGDVAAACRHFKTDPAMEILYEMTERPEAYKDQFRVEMMAELLQYVAPKKKSQDVNVSGDLTLAGMLSNLPK